MYALLRVSNCFAVIVVRGRLFDPSPSNEPSERYSEAKNINSHFRVSETVELQLHRFGYASTFRFSRLVVTLADEFPILHQIEFIASVELT